MQTVRDKETRQHRKRKGKKKSTEKTSGDFPHVPVNHCGLLMPLFFSTKSHQIRFSESYAAAAATAATVPPSSLNTEPQSGSILGGQQRLT